MEGKKNITSIFKSNRPPIKLIIVRHLLNEDLCSCRLHIQIYPLMIFKHSPQRSFCNTFGLLEYFWWRTNDLYEQLTCPCGKGPPRGKNHLFP